jgi:hypothetical protein
MLRRLRLAELAHPTPPRESSVGTMALRHVRRRVSDDRLESASSGCRLSL